MSRLEWFSFGMSSQIINLILELMFPICVSVERNCFLDFSHQEARLVQVSNCLQTSLLARSLRILSQPSISESLVNHARANPLCSFRDDSPSHRLTFSKKNKKIRLVLPRNYVSQTVSYSPARGKVIFLPHLFLNKLWIFMCPLCYNLGVISSMHC